MAIRTGLGSGTENSAGNMFSRCTVSTDDIGTTATGLFKRLFLAIVESIALWSEFQMPMKIEENTNTMKTRAFIDEHPKTRGKTFGHLSSRSSNSQAPPEKPNHE
jgi:hypothetical protein